MLVRGGLFNNRRLTQLKGFVADPDKKPLLRIVGEVLHCTVERWEFPGHYFSRFAYRKGDENYRYYLTTEESRALWRRVNQNGPKEVLENKLFFQLFCEANGLPAPTKLGVLDRRLLIADGRPIYIESADALRERLLGVVKDSIFAKPSRGGHGKDALRLDRQALESESAWRPVLEKMLAGSERDAYLIQETLTDQHPDIAVFHPASINTVRIDTYTAPGGETVTISALMRFGGSGNWVDNASAGGCFVGVDMETGRLRSQGRSFLEYGAAVYDRHPTTKIAFANREVPHLNAVKELVTKAARLIPSLPLIGWDVGVMSDGPVLIEGNHNYHVALQDLAYGGYRRHPVISELLRSGQK